MRPELRVLRPGGSDMAGCGLSHFGFRMADCGMTPHSIFHALCTGRYRRSKQSGFTMMELVLVVALLGILAAIAIPKYGDTSATEVCAAAEVLVADIRQAQALAIRQNNANNVNFNLNANGYTIVDDAGTKTVTFGVGDYSAIDNTTLAGSSFSFNRTGAPTIGRTITVTSGTESLSVTVTPQTGRVGID